MMTFLAKYSSVAYLRYKIVTIDPREKAKVSASEKQASYYEGYGKGYKKISITFSNSLLLKCTPNI